MRLRVVCRSPPTDRSPLMRLRGGVPFAYRQVAANAAAGWCAVRLTDRSPLTRLGGGGLRAGAMHATKARGLDHFARINRLKRSCHITS
jgi:hypothetical protein